MNLAIILFIISVLEILTPFVTKVVKTTFDELQINYASNIIVFFVATVMGTVFTVTYMLLAGIDFNTTSFFYIIFVIFANWIGSMIGYDKAKQTIKQIAALLPKIEK